MITILHGENTVSSRNELLQLTEKCKQDGILIVRLTGKECTLAKLEAALQPADLFQKQVVIIEELGSLPKSKKRDDLLHLCAATETNCILWEKKLLAAGTLKLFPKAVVKTHKLSNALYAWLDAVTPNVPATKRVQLFHQAVAQNGEFQCFSMFAWLLRQLIQTAEGHPPKGAPFMISKWKTQATSVGLEKLLAIHHELYLIDSKFKTSTLQLSLVKQLDLLLSTL